MKMDFAWWKRWWKGIANNTPMREHYLRVSGRVG